ncbi:3-hydroxybutyrate dehydrogenase [Belnapia sp. T18]|uniref:3-hydroxybutyrate dehydrogenase n=1 Tax=Belnapia arida TaxID=2804533 RepID=A0ABS1U672_9PROT|nr:3-hydroxybutyrate dehydrogenase [Belnapia arida]MBL6080148.1 3-hydroxybutyrate dehydrogenase [Belnapia arida]
MDQVLAGRTALVTGSTSGIGLGIAKIYAEAGAKVMLNGFGKPEEIAKARAEIGALQGGGDAPYSAADLSKPEAVRQMVREAEAALGRIDILVNNAGIQFVAPVDEFPDDKFDAIIAINFASNFHAIKAALPGMKARNWGRIINVASAHGLVASPHKVAYVSAKHAVVGMTKTVALEVAKLPITCNAICPGFVRTPLAEAQVGPLAKEHGVSEQQALEDYLLDKQPSKRWIEVDEVAQMALYLVGPGSGGVNGAALSIDGGWLAA